jgi:hypothetical protein
MFKFKQFVEYVEDFELDEDGELSEVVKRMSFRQRQQRSRLAKGKNRNKMKFGARRQKKKIADPKRLKRRARRSARRALIKKVSGGKSPSSTGAKNVAMGKVSTGGMQRRLVTKTRVGVRHARTRDRNRKSGGAGLRRTG